MNYAHGGDFSTWQDKPDTPQVIDFHKAKAAGLTFAYLKASQSIYKDPDFLTGWPNAKNAGLLRGSYHFLTWDKSPVAQADFYWDMMRPDPGELPLIVDFEWWRVTPAGALGMLSKFIDRLRSKTPHPIGIYTSASFWREFGSKKPYWAKLPLWLCDISGPVEVPKPWETWFLWQYTFKLPGPVYGAESLDLDGDRYNGTAEEMIARFGPAQHRVFLAGVSRG